MPFSIPEAGLRAQEKEYTWNPFKRADIPAVNELLQAVNAADDNEYNNTIADLERQYDDEWSDAEKDARVVYTPRGMIAAFVRFFVNPRPERENIAFVQSEVHPDERDHGLEAELYEWTEARIRERMNELNLALPRIIRASFPATLRERTAFYKARGFEIVRYFSRMQRDLSEDVSGEPLPAGLTLRTYSPELDEPLRNAVNDAFRDHWGHQAISEEDWQTFFVKRSNFRPDLALIAMDGDEIAACCINVIRAEENERLGIRQGWVHMIGTRRAYRKRGIASALVCETMRRFRAEGMDYVGLSVDAENPTGAFALYERLGFHAMQSEVVMDKRL